MKLKRVVALMLAASMLAAVAGCSKVKKVTGADFVAACEKIGAEEVDYEDMNEVEESDLEDGVYSVLDSDDIEDLYEDYESSSSSSSMSMYSISAPDVESIVDADDLEEMTVFAKMDQNFDDISDPEDIENLDVNGVVGIQMTLTDSDMVEDFMGGIADSLDEYGIDVEDLSSDEYYVGKNEAYLRISVSAEDLVAAFLDSETYGYLEMMDVDIEDALESLTGDLAVATYINGENVVVLIGMGINNTTEYLDEFCGDLGLSSPSKLPSNPEIAESICDTLDDTLGSMLSSFAALAGVRALPIMVSPEDGDAVTWLEELKPRVAPTAIEPAAGNHMMSLGLATAILSPAAKAFLIGLNVITPKTVSVLEACKATGASKFVAELSNLTIAPAFKGVD